MKDMSMGRDLGPKIGLRISLELRLGPELGLKLITSLGYLEGDSEGNITGT
jgi:hypothetical protein